MTRERRSALVWSGFDRKSGRLYGLGAMWQGAFLVALSSGAFAQAPDVQPTASPSAAQSEERAESLRAEARRLSVPEKQKRLDSMIAGQRQDLARVSQLVSEVRSERDMVRLSAIEQKLDVIAGLLRLSESSSQAFQKALAEGDDDKMDANYTRVVLASARSAQFRSEALASVGSAAVYTGITNVEMLLDEDAELPPGLLGVGSFLGTPAGSPPPAASTF